MGPSAYENGRDIRGSLVVLATAANGLGWYIQLFHQVFLEVRSERLLCNGLGHAGKPLVALRRGDRKMRVNPGNADGTVFFLVKFRTAQPTAKESSQLVSRLVLVFRVPLDRSV